MRDQRSNKKKAQLVTRSGYTTIIDYRGLSLDISFLCRLFYLYTYINFYPPWTVHRVHVYAYYALT